MLYYRLSQKLKLLGYGKSNHLTTYSNTLSHVWAKTTFLIGESQHVGI